MLRVHPLPLQQQLWQQQAVGIAHAAVAASSTAASMSPVSIGPLRGSSAAARFSSRSIRRSGGNDVTAAAAVGLPSACTAVAAAASTASVAASTAHRAPHRQGALPLSLMLLRRSAMAAAAGPCGGGLAAHQRAFTTSTATAAAVSSGGAAGATAAAAAPSAPSGGAAGPHAGAGAGVTGVASSVLPERSSVRALKFLRPPAQILLDIEAHALTEADPRKSASLAAYQAQFNDLLCSQNLNVTELMQVFRSWVSHMPSPPSLPYIHSYLEARVRLGHRVTQVLTDLIPLNRLFNERTIVLVMLLCAKQRSAEETLACLRFLHTYTSTRIPLTLPLMNHMIDNFSRQNDISGAAILYDELSSLGLNPDADTYRSMYLGFTRMHEWEACFSVLGHMQARGIPLTVEVFEDIIAESLAFGREEEDGDGNDSMSNHNKKTEGAMLTLQRIASFAASQPHMQQQQQHADTTSSGATHPSAVAFPSPSPSSPPPLAPSARCYELLLRAYLTKGQLDISLQIYFELRAAGFVLADGLDGAALGMFNELLATVARTISFQDAINILADRVQAYEKQQLQQPTTPVEPEAQGQGQVPAPVSATATAIIPPPDISSFNVLLRIAGLEFIPSNEQPADVATTTDATGVAGSASADAEGATPAAAPDTADGAAAVSAPAAASAASTAAAAGVRAGGGVSQADAPQTIQLLVSELQRVQLAMNTETFNILIQSYKRLGEVQGMKYIYEEFKKQALAHVQQAAALTAAAAVKAQGGQQNAQNDVRETFSSADIVASNPSLASLCPDVNTFNIMLEQIDPQNFTPAPAAAATEAASDGVQQPRIGSGAVDSSLSPSERDALEQVASLLSDMSSFDLVPDERTFKLVMRIMSSVGRTAASSSSSTTTTEGAAAAEAAEASTSPHVVRFFNLLMDMVVAQQKRHPPPTQPSSADVAASKDNAASLATGDDVGPAAGLPAAGAGGAPIGAAVAAASSSSLPSAASASAAVVVDTGTRWHEFLNFLMRSSSSPASRATNFRYVLMCLRRMRREPGLSVPNEVVKKLLNNLLMTNESAADSSDDNIMMMTGGGGQQLQQQQREPPPVHWLQAVQLVREFAQPDQGGVDPAALSVILRAAKLRDEQVMAASALTATADADSDAPQPQPPPKLLVPMLVRNLQRVLVWDEPLDTSSLEGDAAANALLASSSFTSSLSLDDEDGDAAAGSGDSRAIGALPPPAPLSLSVRDTVHWSLFMSCMGVRAYAEAIDVVADMERHQVAVREQHAQAVARGELPKDSSSPQLHVSSMRGVLFKQLLDAMRRYTLVRLPSGELSDGLLRTLFERVSSGAWGPSFRPPPDAYRGLMDESLRYGCTKLASFTYECAVRNWREAKEARQKAAAAAASATTADQQASQQLQQLPDPATLAPTLSLTVDFVYILHRSGETQLNAHQAWQTQAAERFLAEQRGRGGLGHHSGGASAAGANANNKFEVVSWSARQPTAYATFVAQVKLVLSTASALQLQLTSDLIKKLAQCFESMRSRELAQMLLSYTSSFRRAPDVRLLVPLISLSSLHAHHAQGMELYRQALAVAPGALDLHAYAQLLRLQEYAPTPQANAMWQLWQDLKTKPLAGVSILAATTAAAAAAAARGNLHNPGGSAALLVQQASGQQSDSPTVQLVRCLLVASRSRAPIARVKYDLPYIGQIIEAFSTWDDKAATPTPTPRTRTPQQGQGGGGGGASYLSSGSGAAAGAAGVVVFPSPSSLLGQLVSVAPVFTLGQMESLQREWTNEVVAAQKDMEAAAAAAATQTNAASSENTTEATTSAPAAPETKGGEATASVTPPTAPLSDLALRFANMSEQGGRQGGGAHQRKDLGAAAAAAAAKKLRATLVGTGGEQPKLSWREIALQKRAAALAAKNAAAAAPAAAAPAFAAGVSSVGAPAATAGGDADVAPPSAPAVDSAASVAAEPDVAAAKQVQPAAVDVATTKSAPSEAAADFIATAAAAAAAEAEAVAAEQAADEEEAKEAAEQLEQQRQPQAADSVAAAEASAATSSTPTPAAAAAVAGPPKLDSFVQWSALAARAAKLATSTEQRAALLREGDTARHVRNLLFHDKQLSLGLRKLAAQEQQQQAVAATIKSEGRSLTLPHEDEAARELILRGPRIAVNNVEEMVQLLLAYCLQGRSVQLLHLVAEQLQECRRLPGPAPFIDVSRQALAQWVGLQDQLDALRPSQPQQKSSKLESQQQSATTTTTSGEEEAEAEDCKINVEETWEGDAESAPIPATKPKSGSSAAKEPAAAAGNSPAMLQQRADETVRFLRASLQWACTAAQLPTDVWRSAAQVQPGKKEKTAGGPASLPVTATTIGFNATELGRRLMLWRERSDGGGVQSKPSSESMASTTLVRLLNVYAFKTVCLLAVRGQFGRLGQFLRVLSRADAPASSTNATGSAASDEASSRAGVGLGVPLSLGSVYRSAVLWLVHHGWQSAAAEVWTSLIAHYVPRLRGVLLRQTAEELQPLQDDIANAGGGGAMAQRHSGKARKRAAQAAAALQLPEHASPSPASIAASASSLRTVSSLCQDLLTTLVQRPDPDAALLFRVYTSMRALSIAPPEPLVRAVIPADLVDNLTEGQRLLYIVVERVQRLNVAAEEAAAAAETEAARSHEPGAAAAAAVSAAASAPPVSMDILVKLFTELMRVPSLTPKPFRMPKAGERPPVSAVSAAANAQPSRAQTELHHHASDTLSPEWPLMPVFLDAVASRFVEEYIAPLNVRQRVVYPEFVDMVKTLVLHLDSSDALVLTPATPTPQQALRLRRDRLWQLFQAMEGLVVFTVPMIHHLAQSLATKDAVMLFGADDHPATAAAEATSSSSARNSARSAASSSVTSTPIPTLVHSLWALCLHHGRVDPLTLEFLFLALFRYYRAAQARRGLTPRMVRSVEYYRHVLYDTPYTPPSAGADAGALGTGSHAMAATSSPHGALTLPHASGNAPALAHGASPTLGDVVLSGFQPGVLAAYTGFDRLDPPLPNLLHAFFTKVGREWARLNEEDAAAVWQEAVQAMKEAEANGQLDEKERLAAEARARADRVGNQEVPLNVHAFNLLVQSFLLFQASSSAPIRWAALTHVRSAMSSRAGGPLLLNHTSTLMLVDALIEARELEQARAVLPPAVEVTVAGTAAGTGALGEGVVLAPHRARGMLLPAALRGSAAASARLNAATAGTIERLFPQGTHGAESTQQQRQQPQQQQQKPAQEQQAAATSADAATSATSAQAKAQEPPTLGLWARIRRKLGLAAAADESVPEAPAQAPAQPAAVTDATAAAPVASPASPAAAPVPTSSLFSAANRAGFAAPSPSPSVGAVAKESKTSAPASTTPQQPNVASTAAKKNPPRQTPAPTAAPVHAAGTAKTAAKKPPQAQAQKQPQPQPPLSKPVAAAAAATAASAARKSTAGSRTSAPPGKKRK